MISGGAALDGVEKFCEFGLAFPDLQAGPGAAVECLARGGQCGLDMRGGTDRGFAEHSFGGRVDDGVIFGGRHPFAVDIK